MCDRTPMEITMAMSDAHSSGFGAYASTCASARMRPATSGLLLLICP